MKSQYNSNNGDHDHNDYDDDRNHNGHEPSRFIENKNYFLRSGKRKYSNMDDSSFFRSCKRKSSNMDEDDDDDDEDDDDDDYINNSEEEDTDKDDQDYISNVDDVKNRGRKLINDIHTSSKWDERRKNFKNKTEHFMKNVAPIIGNNLEYLWLSFFFSQICIYLMYYVCR